MSYQQEIVGYFLLEQPVHYELQYNRLKLNLMVKC